MKLYKIQKSSIHGKGMFATQDIGKNKYIGAGIEFILGLIPQVTDFGSMINHSYSPTARLEWSDGEWMVTANKNIKKGEEITLDYRDTPWYIHGPEAHYQ